MKAVFFESDWPEEFGQEILVTYLRKDESESDAILRAMEIYDPKYDFYVKEHFGVEDGNNRLQS
jgi:hypothetical protein